MTWVNYKITYYSMSLPWPLFQMSTALFDGRVSSEYEGVRGWKTNEGTDHKVGWDSDLESSADFARKWYSIANSTLLKPFHGGAHPNLSRGFEWANRVPLLYEGPKAKLPRYRLFKALQVELTDVEAVSGLCNCFVVAWSKMKNSGAQTWSWRVVRCHGPNGKGSDSEIGKMVPLQRNGADVVPRGQEVLDFCSPLPNTAAVKKKKKKN